MAETREPMSAREEIAWIVGYNVAVFATIAAITLGGLYMTGEWHGLWSLLLMLALGSRSSKKDTPNA